MTKRKLSTEGVRFRFVEYDYLVDGEDDHARSKADGELFDAWLAAEKAKAWDEGAIAALERAHAYGAEEKAKYDNPYRRSDG